MREQELRQLIIETIFNGNDNYGFARLGLEHVRGDRVLKIIAANDSLINTPNSVKSQKKSRLGKRENDFP